MEPEARVDAGLRLDSASADRDSIVGWGDAAHGRLLLVGHLDTPDGRRLFATRRTPLTDGDGRVIGVLGTARDITLQRRAEEAQLTSDARYRALVESTASIVVVTDLQGRFIEENVAWRTYTGQAHAEYCEFGWLAAIHPEDREGVHSSRTAPTGRHERYEVHYRLWNDEDRRFRHVQERGALRRDPGGAAVEWISGIVDVDDHAMRDLFLRRHQHATARLAELGARLTGTTSVEEIVRDVPDELAEMLSTANVHLRVTAGLGPAALDLDCWLHDPTRDLRKVEAHIRRVGADERDVHIWAEPDDSDVGTIASGLMLPVSSPGHVVGSIELYWADRTALDSTMVDSAIAATQMVGSAIDRAIRHEEEHLVVEHFQQAILRPIALPEQYEVASRYVPAAAATRMGGDWFDSVPLPGGRIAVVIGDVVGHGAAAAADMAELRAVMATLLALDMPLVETMEIASSLTRNRGGDRMATVLVLALDPTNGTLTHLSAGHPPFLIRRADGTMLTVETPRRPLLGVAHRSELGAAVVGFGPGDVAVAFTDGLVERRDRSIDHMIATVGDAVSTHGEQRCDQLVDHIIEAAAPTYNDDVALVVLRVLDR
jgi:PAS domain S-box-containing protein